MSCKITQWAKSNNFTLSMLYKCITTLSKSPHLKCCLNVHMKAPPVNTLHITLWCLACEFVSIWCTVHPCGGHSGTPDLLKAPDHLSNLQQNGPSKESNVSFLALGQISFRSSVLKHFNPLTWVWCLIRNRQLRRSNQQSAGDYRAVKNIYTRIHFHSVCIYRYCNSIAADLWPHWPVSF